jgi:hypothetical protein
VLRVETGRQVGRLGRSVGGRQNSGIGGGHSSDKSWRGLDCEPNGTVVMGRAQFSLHNSFSNIQITSKF